MAESFSKNEATDLIDNKGSALEGMSNEPTVGEEKVAGRRVGTGSPVLTLRPSPFSLFDFLRLTVPATGRL
jgi:hypothetical protein